MTGVILAVELECVREPDGERAIGMRAAEERADRLVELVEDHAAVHRARVRVEVDAPAARPGRDHADAAPVGIRVARVAPPGEDVGVEAAHDEQAPVRSVELPADAGEPLALLVRRQWLVDHHPHRQRVVPVEHQQQRLMALDELQVVLATILDDRVGGRRSDHAQPTRVVLDEDVASHLAAHPRPEDIGGQARQLCASDHPARADSSGFQRCSIRMVRRNRLPMRACARFDANPAQA